MKEVVLILGLPQSGKHKYAVKEFLDHQIIYPLKIREAIEYTKVQKSDSSVHLIVECVARASMIIGLPIAVVAQSLETESILIWRKFAVEHGYKLKVLLLDAPLEECFSKSPKTDKATLGNLSKLSKRLEQLKIILSMKDQHIVDKFKIIKPGMEEKQDEILQN